MLSKAKSALIGSFVGPVWLLWGASFLGAQAWIWLVVISVLSCTILAWCIACFRYIRRRQPPSPVVNKPSPFGWPYRVVVLIEVVLIAAGTSYVSAHHRRDLVPIVIAIVVGLHFFPLAKIFKVPGVYIVGVVTTAIPLVSLAIRDHAIRDFVSCSAIGAFMLAGSAGGLQRLSKKVVGSNTAPTGAPAPGLPS